MKQDSKDMKRDYMGTEHPPEIRVVSEDKTENGQHVDMHDHDGSTILGSISHYDGTSEEEDEPIFKPFTKRSYENQLIKEAEDKKKEEEKKNLVQEGRLVDGELKFGDDDDDDEKKERNPSLTEGGPLPPYLDEEFPEEFLRKPIEEIDPNIRNRSFVIITKRLKNKNIYRFSATKSLFMFSPWNRWRRLMLLIATNQFFDYFIILTILVNMAFLAIDQEANAYLLSMSEYVFTAIYSLEMLIKVQARGFIVYKYTYLRDPWNWIDFTVIVSAYLTIILERTGSGGDIGSIAALRTFRVLRALKTVAVIPGLKIIISALLRSLRMLIEVVILKLFCMMVFALFALQVYVGVLRQKCVRNLPGDIYVSDSYYMEYIKDSSHWYAKETGDDYIICGNASGAGGCPKNYTCLPGIGENPNWGYTTFDNFGWAMLNAFQLITLDYWEDLYDKVIRASGPWNIIFFIVVVFFGSFYLVNMMLAVVNMSYEEEVSSHKRDRERDQREQKESKERKKSKKMREKRRKAEYAKSDINHLHVMSAVNGSKSVSSTSLKSVGNGVVWKNKSDPHKESVRDEAKIISTTKQGNNEKQVQNKAKTESKNNKSNGKGKHLNKQNSKKNLQGYDNPIIITDDNQSINSGDNNGDPPVILINDGEDDELVIRNCDCCSYCCCNYIHFLKFQNALHRIVADFAFEIFITFCIMLNVLFMGIEHYGMSTTLEITLKIANYIFTAIFTLEAIVKMLAQSKMYFKSGWNVFDLIIVVASLIDLGVEDVDGLSAFRAFRLLRLLRVFKLAQTWSTMRMLLSIILRTLGALGNLTFVLLIVAYIFAVIGMQLFSDKYKAEIFYPDPIPRWNFTDFYHSMMLIFRILCGEWIEPLWDCMRAEGEICMLVFLPTLVFGNLMVLNLFLALLLNSFATDSLQGQKKESKEDSNMKKGWSKIKGIFKSKKNTVQPEDEMKKSVADIVTELRKQQEEKDKEEQDNNENTTDSDKNTDKKSNKTKKQNNKSKNMEEAFQTNRNQFNKFEKELDSNKSDKAKSTDSQKEDIADKKPKTKSEEDDEPVDPDDIQPCFPRSVYEKCCTCCLSVQDSMTGIRWTRFRRALYTVTEHKAFEYFILIIIFASSISLCFEDIYLYRKPTLSLVLYYLDIIYAVIFSIEMIFKMFALGLKKYFTSFWTILDFCIVVISYVSIVGNQLGLTQISAFRVLRTLRALRPLRAISRWQGMRIVVNALVHAIPSIFNVFLVCVVFWLIFSIAGVQLFGGKFYKCIDVDDGYARLDASIVPNKSVCEQFISQGRNYRWANSKVNFDNVPQGYLALVQVATFEGWIEVMYDAVDTKKIDEQPEREANIGAYIFFVIFIIWGSFFSLNLFIGVIIDNFNMLKKKYEGGYVGVLLTTNQKNYYNTIKKLGNRKPQKTIKRPKNKVQGFFFDVSVSTKFELAVVILILFNMVSMGVEHYHQSDAYNDSLDILNIVFTTIFTLEAIVKIVGMRWHYFRRGWNVFDFLIVILSIAGVVLDDILREVFVTPSLLRVVRVFRIGRVLRLIKVAKGIRKLLFALMISLPALFNIVMLLFLVVFMYSIFGMALFGQVKPTGSMNDVVNFQTFGNSMLLLFRLTTAGGWNEIIDPLMITQPDCSPDYMTMPDGEVVEVTNGDCGNSGLAIFYMVTFILLTYLIIINMYIAVILENFSQAHEQEEVGITEDDFEMFYVVWERYDPHATQFIKYDQLSDFVADLDQPLGMPRPNEIALVAFDLPIYDGDRLHCLDILTSLVKHVLGSVEMTEEFRNLKAQVEQKYHEAFPTRVQQIVRSTTMQHKKRDVAAKTLQRSWRKHRVQSNIRKITEMAMELKRSQTRASMSVNNGDKPSQLSAAKNIPGIRPSSKSSTRSIKAANTAAQVRKKSGLSRTLKVPAAAEISLPSDDNDVNL